MQEEGRKSAAEHAQMYMGEDGLTRFCAMLAGFRGRILVVCDPETAQHCLPLVEKLLPAHFIHTTQVSGEAAKDIEECVAIWNRLTDLGFDRGDVMINLGGGVVTDLGGFAASTYKRGIVFYHMPTTLLAMADAAVGGKTGINLQAFKNQIGTFQNPKGVIVHVPFLKTLPDREVRSGYAEVLKHYLIHDRQAWELASHAAGLPSRWEETVKTAVKIKLHFTQADPTEKGLRKALNFGHTVGHALESHFMCKPASQRLLHGEAIAIGMHCESAIAFQRGLLSPAEFGAIRDTLHKVFGHVGFAPEEIPAIAQRCLQDKKNGLGRVNSTLLNGIGSFALDQWLELPEIEASLLGYLTAFQTPSLLP